MSGPMRQLVLLRHAKAAVDAATGEDYDRPLAARGLEDAPAVVQALDEAGHVTHHASDGETGYAMASSMDHDRMNG